MDLIQNFVFDDYKHDVSLLKDGDETLFRATDIGKVLGIINIHDSIKDFDEDEKVLDSTYTLGGNQNSTFLTEQGVYKLVLKSRKPIAKPFQKWVFNVIKEIRRTGKYEMQKTIDDFQDKCNAEVRSQKDKVDEIAHKASVMGCDKRLVVYLGKIKTMEDNTVLIKIGSTNDIKQRAVSLAYEFGSIAIINTFECENNVEFEKFLHQHVDIVRYKYTEIINDLKRSSEVFRMTSQQLERTVNIMLRNVKRFRSDKGKRDIDDLIETNPVVKKMKIALGMTESTKNPDAPEYQNNRGITTLNGSKVQQYTMDGELVKTFQRLIDVSRFQKIGSKQLFSRSSVDRACKERTEYKGYRWLYLDRNLDDYTIQDIGETVVDKKPHSGFVATLDPSKKYVTDVFLHFKALSFDQGFKSGGAIQKRMNKGQPLDDGRHIVKWDDVEDKIQNDWLKDNVLPKIKAPGIKINRLDKNTLDIIQTYGTMNEVLINYPSAARTLRSAIEGGVVHHGYKWSYA